MRLGLNLVVERLRTPEDGDDHQASSVGVQVGDHLLAVNGLEVVTRAEAVRELKQGGRAEVLFWRPDSFPADADARRGPSAPVLPHNPAVALRGLTGAEDGLIVPATVDGRSSPVASASATFGPPPSCDLLHLVVADPASGCAEPQNEFDLRDAAVLVSRGQCRFQDKTLNMQWAGAGAVIVAGNPGDSVLHMPASDDKGRAPPITVPAVMVSHETGRLLRTLAGSAAASTFVQLLPKGHQCSGAQLAALPAVRHVPSRRAGDSHRAVVDEDGSVTVSAAPKTPPEPTSVPLARGGALYAAVSAPLADRAGAEAALRLPVVDLLPPSWRGALARPLASAVANASVEGDTAPGAGRRRQRPRLPASGAGVPFPLVMQADFLRASFGGPLPVNGSYRLAAADPLDACTPLANLDEVEGAVVLVARGTCTVSGKARTAQEAGAAAVVVVNNEPGLVTPHGAGSSSDLRDIQVPVVIVTQAAGNTLLAVVATATARAGRLAAVAAETEAGSPTELDAAERVADAAADRLKADGPQVAFFGRPDVADVWAELTGLQAYTAWQAEEEDRKKQYRELARRHHPDKDGTTERFEVLKAAHAAADYFLRQKASAAQHRKK